MLLFCPFFASIRTEMSFTNVTIWQDAVWDLAPKNYSEIARLHMPSNNQ